jgi:hypothetical protein
MTVNYSEHDIRIHLSRVREVLTFYEITSSYGYEPSVSIAGAIAGVPCT